MSDGNPHKDEFPGAVLITGAAKRIGRSLALDMGKRGWKVAVHYRSSKQAAEELVHEITQSGGVGAIVGGDLARAEDVEGIVPACAQALGAPCCLINNASEFHNDNVEDMSQELWAQHLDVNLKAPVFLARALYLGLPEAKRGNIINIIDQRVWRLTPEFFSYTLSKSGLWTATQTLAQAMAPKVRVNAIGPGPVLRSVYQTDAEFAAEGRRTLLGRGPDLEEIASAVQFILSASAMTGQMIALDGGQHLIWREEDAQPNER